MGDIIRFSRRHRARKSRKRRGTRSLVRAPWQPLVTLVIVAAAAYAAGVRFPESDAATIGHASFQPCLRANESTCVVDGDTIRYGGVRIRLEDIDAPEVFSPRCDSEKALGRRATERLVEWMNAGPFEIVRVGERDIDIYGRKLRVIERNGESAGDVLVSEGLARRWDGARRSWCG